MLGEILAWGTIGIVYAFAFGALALPKHWYRTAQVLFLTATAMACMRIIWWAFTSSRPRSWRMSFGGFGLLIFISGALWFVRKVQADIRGEQAVKANPNDIKNYQRDLIETWQRMIVLAERKYTGGKEPRDISFSEIFQRQPAFIQLVPLLSKQAIDALDTDVREELTRKERARPVALRALLAKEISRIETELELFPRLAGLTPPQKDHKLIFEINKPRTSIRVDQSPSALRIWLDIELRFENKDTYPIAFKHFDVSMHRYGIKDQQPGFDIGIRFAIVSILCGGASIALRDFEGMMIQERRLTPFYSLRIMIGVEDDQIQQAKDLDILDTIHLAMHGSGDQLPLVASLHPHWELARERENGTQLMSITGVPTIEMDYRRLS
jgi:hypothetical protein